MDINKEDLLIELIPMTHIGYVAKTTFPSYAGVKITHKPSGVNVTYTKERSLLKCKEKALIELRDKLKDK